MPRKIAIIAALLGLSLIPAAKLVAEPAINLKLLSDDFDRPVQIASHADQSHDIVILEQGGVAKSFSNTNGAIKDVVSIENLINQDDTRGTLSIAFNPLVNSSYINYVDIQGDLVVARFPPYKEKAVDEEAIRVILKIARISLNQLGSQSKFARDGTLFISSGDGENKTSGDTAQSTQTLLGKILRITPSENATRYKIPLDNPFASRPPNFPEIWAIGFRNPDQLSYDSQTDRLFAIDNSENFHEINLIERGKNYGWPKMDSSHCVQPPCLVEQYVLPIIEFPRNGPGRLISGGVYRGSQLTGMHGDLIFAHTHTGKIFAANNGAGAIWSYREVANLPKNSSSGLISSIGSDKSGELYLTTENGLLFALKSGEQKNP